MSLKSVRALPRKQVTVDGTVVGWIVGHDAVRGLLVDFPRNPGPPVAARTVVVFDRPTVDRAIVTQQGAVLLFEQGDPAAPILLGLVQPLTLHEIHLDRQTDSPKEALVDGRRVVLDGKEEVVLRCGEASITLRHNGKVVIKGTQVISHSSGVNRIRGGSVQIN